MLFIIDILNINYIILQKNIKKEKIKMNKKLRK